MEKVSWKVDGMTCANCALTINKYLDKQGMQHIRVNPIDGDVSFELIQGVDKNTLKKGIDELGYHVTDEASADKKTKKPFLSTNVQRLIFCLPFTLVLMLHMLESVIHIHWLMNPWIQLTLCMPVFLIGMRFFGRSAIISIRNKMPNMNVLVALGALAAFSYSLIGTLIGQGEQYLFYETAATIITLVFFGNYLEDASMQSTQRALKSLMKSQKVMANMIAFDENHQEVIFPIENTQLKVGDLILIRSGEQVPIDAKILWGDAHVNESLLTGESIPVHKKAKDNIIGGSILESGSLKAQVTATGDDTILSGILQLVKEAQGEKPPIQHLADKISSIFVPIVVGIAVVTFIGNYIYLQSFTDALLRSIAVLVIACPCAMGLATPAAIAVGLGRAARNGILFRNATSLENFRNIRQVVFDKTGTLTTGSFKLSNFKQIGTDEQAFKTIVFSLEKYSTHPIAVSIAAAFKEKQEIKWKSIEEVKGIGMKGIDKDGNEYWAGSYKIASSLTNESNHNVYILKNNQLIGWLDLEDEIRPESKEIIAHLKRLGLKTILLSGDRKEKCKMMQEKLGLDEFIAEQSPEEKLNKIAALTKESPTAMVGDGINDAPALAKATIGISLSEASQLAIQSAQVVLMNSGLKKLPTALGLGKHTYITIKQNLFWAFFYNIIALPVAAFGLLTPTLGALVMGLSDVVLAINSVRLFVKKVV
ncbi:MAG: cadmium-translocating P-type ATPase [Bacteroidota bacterium]|jgi:Cu+-exporting ATPase|nr:cadmium-translocating P-type ATPase [Chitinophagaceae bacterium]